MPENMRLFCGIFLLSVCRLPAPVTDFPVPVPLFWYRGEDICSCETGIWYHRGYAGPEKFIYSGIGDMISKITALYDWIFEEKAGCGEVNDFAVMIAKKAVNSFVRTPYESIKDELFLKELLDSLAMSGIANEIAGSSAPTSGSEHLISHALDKILEVPQLHGIQVGIATYIMAKVQDHRYIRVSTVLQDTGFWDYVATLHMKRSDFLKAIDMAPSIKPHRHTYLHEEKYREAAKKLVLEDEVLSRVLED